MDQHAAEVEQDQRDVLFLPLNFQKEYRSVKFGKFGTVCHDEGRMAYSLFVRPFNG
jgi:hypothetical protein